MDFTFNEDQRLFQQTVRDFLTKEVTPETIRRLWDEDTGRSDALWAQLAELGLTGMTVPEQHGGLGMDAVDFVLLAEECGYAALPEPLVHTALVAAPLLADIGGGVADEWLPKIAAGEARVMVGLEQNGLVEDAHIADLLLLEKSGDLYAVEPAATTQRANPSVDPSRRLFAVDFEPSAARKLADSPEPTDSPEQANSPEPTDSPEQANAAEQASGSKQANPAEWLRRSLDRGALGSAAQALGLAQRMLDISVQYTGERHQFGKPIGSFQAVKHLMADVAVRLEYARAPVYRAAWSVARGHTAAATTMAPRPVTAAAVEPAAAAAAAVTPAAAAALHVSHAKLAACEAANLAAKHCIQVHGAMGYTWEVDLHIFMKQAWALAGFWGDTAFHKGRVADALFEDGDRC